MISIARLAVCASRPLMMVVTALAEAPLSAQPFRSAYGRMGREWHELRERLVSGSRAFNLPVTEGVRFVIRAPNTSGRIAQPANAHFF